MNLKKKKVTVVGLGNSGFNAAVLLKSVGAISRVTDSGDTADIRKNAAKLKAKGIACEYGAHTLDFIKGSSLVVVSPGVPDSSAAIQWAVKDRIPIIGEMELGYRFCKGRIIAITGTNGKTTVTTLIGEMMKDAGFDTVVCGNIGNSLCGEIKRIKGKTVVVMEVSSFQLERIQYFKPHIAIILNITNDHLDRYGNFEDYFRAKLKIYANQDRHDRLVLNYDAENLRHLKSLPRSKVLFYGKNNSRCAAYVDAGTIVCRVGAEKRNVCAVSDLRLKGLHNLENVIGSSLAAFLAGAGTDSMRRTIRRFRGIHHRFETVDIIGGVEYINDSKGTTVDSTLRALESCDKPVILIAGGRDKESDFTVIRDAVKKKVKSLVLIGEARKKIGKALGGVVRAREGRDLRDAVAIAGSLARSGEIVLLSPMCASFDMFKNYEHRGDVFVKEVNALRRRTRA